jgi:hypothetical protein
MFDTIVNWKTQNNIYWIREDTKKFRQLSTIAISFLY